MTLTKDQRFTAYCMMLEEFEKGQAAFFCNCFKELFDINFSWDYKLFKETLPELWAKKPKRNLIQNVWFAGSSSRYRISLLKKCIEETS